MIERVDLMEEIIDECPDRTGCLLQIFEVYLDHQLKPPWFWFWAGSSLKRSWSERTELQRSRSTANSVDSIWHEVSRNARLQAHHQGKNPSHSYLYQGDTSRTPPDLSPWVSARDALRAVIWKTRSAQHILPNYPNRMVLAEDAFNMVRYMSLSGYLDQQNNFVDIWREMLDDEYASLVTKPRSERRDFFDIL